MPRSEALGRFLENMHPHLKRAGLRLTRLVMKQRSGTQSIVLVLAPDVEPNSYTFSDN